MYLKADGTPETLEDVQTALRIVLEANAKCAGREYRDRLDYRDRSRPGSGAKKALREELRTWLKNELLMPEWFIGVALDAFDVTP